MSTPKTVLLRLSEKDSQMIGRLMKRKMHSQATKAIIEALKELENEVEPLKLIIKTFRKTMLYCLMNIRI